MSLQNSRTTCGYINWSELTNLILKLERDGESKFALLISVGSFTGLRISDTLTLTWEMLLDKEVIELNEKKTGKLRRIKINKDLQELVKRIYMKISPSTDGQLVFINKYDSKAINVQWVNVKLKEIFTKYKVSTDNASSHTLRKTFGRKVWESNGCSDKSLVMLSEIFNHSNLQVTKRYLAISEQEIFDVYDSLSF